VFLSIRGMCLRETGRLPEAAEAFAAAARLAPACRGYQVMLASLRAGGWFGPCGGASPGEDCGTGERSKSMRTYRMTRVTIPALALIVWLLAPKPPTASTTEHGEVAEQDPAGEAGGGTSTPLRITAR